MGLAAAKQHDASLKIATALLQVFDRDGNTDSLYSRHMYEYSLPKIEDLITGALGLDALRLLVGLLYDAAVIGQRIRFEPTQDYTSVISGPLPEDESAQYDIFGALTAAVRKSAVRLVEKEGADVRAVMGCSARTSIQDIRADRTSCFGAEPAGRAGPGGRTPARS